MKLRLPHKFQAALMAALASVSFTTLSTGTLGVATGAALLAGQQAQAQVTGIHPMQEVVVAGETYTTTTENGILVAEGDKTDGSPISVPGYTTAEYLVLTSTNGTATNLGRYKVNATANLQNFGTVVLAAGSYQGEGGAVNFNGGQIFVNGGVTLTNDFIIGTSGYVESGYDGAFRLSGNNTFAGSLTLVQDAKMTVDGSSTVQGVVSGEGKTLTLGRSGSLTFNNQTTLGGLAMGSASATFNGAAAAKGNIGMVTSNANSTLTLINTDATISGTQSFKGNLFIGSGSTVTVAQTDSLDYNSTNTITVAAGGTLDFGDKRWTLTSKNTVVLDGGTITGTGDGTDVTKGSLYFHQGGGMLRATSTSTVNAPVRLFTGGAVTTFDVVEDAELAINGIIYGAGNLAKAGAGTLTLKKDATHTGGTSLQGGTLKIATGATLNEGVFTMANGATFVNDGTATIGKVGSASTLGGTLTNTGTLNLAGDITVNTDVATSFEVAAAGEKTYSGGTSGYLSSDTTTYYLVHTTGGTVTNSANITGVSSWTSDEAGNITFTRNATGSGIYYVNEDLTYNAETMGAATGFAIAAGATLTSDGSSYSPGKALHGAGTYALSTNTVALNNGLTLGADWTGTVRITDASANSVNFGNLVNGTQSTLELKGFSGYTTTWYQGAGSGVHTQNLKLTNGSNGYAWRSTGSTSNDGNTAIFSGTWSGDGVFQTQCTKLNFRYEGDISAWEGTFHVNSSSNATIPTLTFSKQATVVNATIEKGNAYLNVAADTDVQFNKAITANTFTVNAGKTVTLAPAANDATYNVGSITNNGTIAVAAGKNASFLVSNNLSFGNVLVNNGGTLAVRGDSGSRTFSFNELAVSGTGHLSNLGSASSGVGYQSTINIANLTNTGESAVLTMGNAARSSATVINLNGGAFSGEIILRGEADNGTRLTGYQFNAAGVAADSIVTFDVLSGKAGNNSLGMGVGADITVQGIRHAEGVSVTSTIYSGNVNAGVSSFDSQGTVVHTITIAGAGEYATSATVKNHVNLAMDGAGTQTFKGDMSAFDGTITVKDGTLALDSAVANAGVVAVNGGSLVLGNSLTTTSAMTVANGATLKLAGTDKLTVGGNLTLAGNLDVSNITYTQGATVTLASYTGTADITGYTLTGLGGHEATLNAASGALTLTFTDTPVPPQESFAEKYGTTIGTVQFVGDSITHGSDKGGTHNGASYRWPMHKIWTDTGVAYDEDGYHVGNFSGNGYVPVFPGGSTYGGEDWDNRHSAQASGRAWQLIQGHSQYSGNTPASLVADYPSDVFFLMIGTNDTLSDYSTQAKGGVGAGDNPKTIYRDLMGYDVDAGTFSGNSRMDTIVDTFAANGGNGADVVVLSIPTWSPNHTNENLPQDFATMKRYNEILKEWCKLQGDNVYFVDVNPGIIDVANTTKPFSGVPSMFNDGLHPSGQGDLIFAANIARQLGYAGRTVGLTRSASTGAGWTSAPTTPITVQVGTPQTFAENTFTVAMGYTVDFGILYGDGEANGWDGAWDTANINGLRVQVGDGTHTGTLTFSEAYVKWGDTVLYSRDNHVAGENFRIAYVNSSVNASDNVAAGYYVWMGDMLIGEALTGTTGSGLFNGIQLTTTGASGTVKNLSWTNTAYAPTTSLYENQVDAFHLVQVNPNPVHDNATHSTLNINFTGATAVSGKQFATTGQPTDTSLLVEHSNFGNSWFGPAGRDHTGNIEVEYSGVTSKLNMFGVISAAVQGNVSTVIGGGSTFATGKYNGSGDYSIFGAYTGNITGKLSIEINNATMNGGVMMGSVNGDCTLGSTDLRINSGADITGDVIGGHHQANGTATTTGDSDITITGGTITGSVYGGNMDAGTIGGSTHVRITGGVITGGVFGGNKTGGTINGTTNVTIEGNLPAIGGNISAQYVTLKDVELNQAGYNDGFDWYGGTITGTEKITLDGYKVADMRASLVTQTLEAKNSTRTTIHNLHLTACEVIVGNESAVTLADTLTLGNTATYSGDLRLENGLVINMENLGASSNGDAQAGDSGYISGSWDVMKLAEGATPSLTVNEDTLQGAGALEGFEFRYDDATGTLSASGENYSTYYIRNAGDTLNLTAEQAMHEELQHVVLEVATGTVGVSGTNTLTTATLANDSTLTFDVDGSLAVNGAITGTGAAVVKTGEGTMTLSGNNTFSGGLTVDEGTVSVTSKDNLGTGTITANQNGTILFTSDNLGSVDSLAVEGTGALRLVTSIKSESGQALNTISAPNLYLEDNGAHSARYYYDGATNLSGVDHLYLDGGQLWVNANMVYDGDVTFNQTTYEESGTLTGAALRVSNGAKFSGNIDVAEDTQFAWCSNSTVEFAGPVSGSGNLNLKRFNSDGTFKVSNDASNYQGALTSDAGITLNVADGAKLTLAEGSSVAGPVTLDGELTMSTAADASSTISGAISGSGTLTKTGDGTLNLTNTNNSTRIANLTVADGTVNLTGVNGGGTGMVKNTLTIQGGGTLNITNHHDALGWGNNGLQHLVMGGSSGEMATLNLAPSTGATITTGFDLTMNGDAQITGQAFNTLANNGTAITVSGTNNSISGISVRNAVNINTNESAELSIVSLSQYSGSSAAVTKTGTGKLILTGNPTNKTTSVEAGTLVLTSDVTNLGGDLTIGDAATLTLSGSPLSTGGALTFEGGATLDLSNYTFSGTDPVTLVTTTGSGSIVGPASWDDVKLTFGASVPEEAYLSVQGNSLVLTFTPPTPSDDLIWSGGDGNWSSDNWHTQADPDTPVEFTDGTSVTFKSGTSNVTLTQSVSAPTTTLQNGAVLAVNRDGNTLTTALAGNGTFVLDNNTTSLPNGVSLDQANWHGIVRLTSTSDQQNKDLRPLVTSDSWIEFNGFTGYTNSWATSAGGKYAIDLSQNIILTDTADGQPAWIWTGMGSNADPMYEGFQSYVTGKWSGDGTLAVKYPTSKTVGNTSAQSFRFSGDISDWNGKITVHKNSAELTNIGLYFQGEATQVNVNIEKPRGQVFVHVGDGTESFSTSFNGTVDATTFEVKNNATATITGSTTVSGTATTPALSGAGNLVVDNGENVVTLNGASNLSGTTTVNSGKLQLNAGGDMGAVTVNGGDFNSTGAADLTMDGLNVNGGTAHIGNSGEVDLGAITLSADGDLVLNTTVTASSLTTNGGTLTFAGANMLTTTGNINLSGGATFDLSNIKYSAAESDQVIILAHSESGTITLGGEYTFTNPQYADTRFSLTFNANNDLVLVVNPDVTKWPTGTSVSYTYGTGEDKQTHYDIRIEEMGQDPIDAHGYNFSQPEGGVVEFNPDLFDNETHTYTDGHNIVMHSDTTIVVEEGKTVQLTGQLQGNGVGDNVSGNLTKDGAGTLEMAINSNTTGSQGDLQNIYEGSVDVLEGTLRVVAGTNSSLIAAANGTHVAVDKDATLIFEDGNGISIPTGHRGNYKPGDNRSVVLSAAGTPAIVQNAYISQDGVRPEDAQDGGRASLNNLYEFRIGNLQDTSHAISVELADITTQSMVLNGAVDIEDSDIKVSGYLDVSNTVGAPNKIHNNSTINFTGNWGHVNNTDVDKTSKINYSGEQSEYTGAWLTGQNKIEVGSTANGGVATRVIDDTQLTIDYTSDQYKGMALGSKNYPSELSLSITLSDLDMPEDLTGYKFTLTFEDFDTSYVFKTPGEYVPLADSDLNVSLFIPEYTGGQWEELVANVQAMYDPTSGNTVFMFQNVVVPEPTTGTLSLLALCALAARRRRK